MDSAAESHTSATRAAPSSDKVDEAICDANRAYQSEDADFIIVSSDGWDFRVHTYHLMSGSTVFRNMLSVNSPHKESTGPPKIELSDHSTETAKDLKLFLDCLYGKMIRTFDHAEVARYVNAISLFKKYECESVIDTLALSLEMALYHSESPLTVFTLAAHLDDTKLCNKALLRAGNWSWKKETDGGIEDSVNGASVFDLTAMPGDRIALLPHVYLCALLRATRKDKIMALGKTDWKAIAEEFTRLINLGKTEVAATR